MQLQVSQIILYIQVLLYLFADALASEVHLVSVSRSVNPSKHEVSLLLDNKFVVVLSMAKNLAADILVCFDIKNTLTTNDNTQLGLITEVRRCHKFFFVLLSNGTVCILFIKSIVCLPEVYASHWYFGLTQSCQKHKQQPWLNQTCLICGPQSVPSQV